MTKDYNASDIEVLSGLEPVQKRPGMYTDTDCPNHLVYEVIDNSVDEAIVGIARQYKLICIKTVPFKSKMMGAACLLMITQKRKYPLLNSY